MKRLWQKNPDRAKFAMFHEQFSHIPNPRDNIKITDDGIRETVESALQADSNTIVVLMGDHGQQIAENPMFSLIIPPNLLNQDSLNILRDNQDMLVTMFDVHKTLVALLGIQHKQVETPRSPRSREIYDMTTQVYLAF